MGIFLRPVPETISGLQVYIYPTFLVKKGLTLMDGPLAQARPTLPPPPDPVPDDETVAAGLALLLLLCFVDAEAESPWLCDDGLAVGLGEVLAVGLGEVLAVGLALLLALLDEAGLCLQRLELLDASRFRFAIAPWP